MVGVLVIKSTIRQGVMQWGDILDQGNHKYTFYTQILPLLRSLYCSLKHSNSANKMEGLAHVR